jgi:hypothetical protein
VVSVTDPYGRILGFLDRDQFTYCIRLLHNLLNVLVQTANKMELQKKSEDFPLLCCYWITTRLLGSKCTCNIRKNIFIMGECILLRM